MIKNKDVIEEEKIKSNKVKNKQALSLKYACRTCLFVCINVFAPNFMSVCVCILFVCMHVCMHPTYVRMCAFVVSRVKKYAKFRMSRAQSIKKKKKKELKRI